MLYELAFLQFYLSREGIFVRGAISQGKHFENDRMIFSQGLVKAYELEKAAVYPSILIDKDLCVEMMQDKIAYYPLYISFSKSDFLIESPDRQYSLDYLTLLFEEGLEQIDELKLHKQAILANVSENYGDTRILQKLSWLAEYHNIKFREIFDADDYEEDYAREIIKDTSYRYTRSIPAIP